MRESKSKNENLNFLKSSTVLTLISIFLFSFLLYLKREYLKRFYLKHRRMDEIKKCRELIEKNSDNEKKAALQYKIARIYHSSLGEYSQAILEYKAFIEKYSSSILLENVIYYMARCWEHLGNFSRAKLEYENLLSKFPNGIRRDDTTLRIEDINTIVNGVN